LPAREMQRPTVEAAHQPGHALVIEALRPPGRTHPLLEPLPVFPHEDLEEDLRAVATMPLKAPSRERHRLHPLLDPALPHPRAGRSTVPACGRVRWLARRQGMFSFSCRKKSATASTFCRPTVS